ncbi:MAG TPA: M14 family zinc carboxypeptidase, partial [candidate division Zixibacteria bacterium]|nr:M14 family zinc carboxypeptidase [candidate division Zixibacteria bacterium]
LETIRRLLDGYGVDPRITNLVDTREIYFCPVVNPDGYVHNETLLDLGFAPMWRKNRNTSYGVGDAVGADLNRNYGYQWGYDNVGSSGNPVVSTFRGDSAFSEPETQNMRAFVNSRDFIFILNYHTYSDLFLWPWGYTQIYSPDDALFNAIGDSVASFNGYTAQIGWQLYVTNGDSDDWNYGATNEHAKIYSFTPEVGGLNDSPSGESQGFWPFPDSIAGQVEENQEPNLLILELADGPERLLPAEIPVWVGPDTANSGDYTLLWSDPGSGGPNAAVSYRLREIFGRQATSDDVEAGDGLWDNVGFTLSTARAVSATHSYFGGASPWLNNSLTAKHYSSVGAGDTVRLNIWYDIETDWDYAYVEASADGSNWVTLGGNVTTATNPNGNNLGNGITGSSGGWVAAKFGLDAYAGGNVLVRLRYRTDGFVLGEGVYFDDITMLTSVDSVVTIADPLSQADFNVTGKTGGSYWYDLRATDGEGQSSVTSPPHGVFVNLGTCAQDCACHADPICDAQTNVLDVVQTVNVAFKGAPATTDPGCPRERTDVDCTGATNVLDVVRLVNVAFKGQSAAANFCDPCAP